MSNFEIFLIVAFCSVPVIALLFVLPKKNKKQGKESLPPAPYVSDEAIKEVEDEEISVEKSVEVKEENKIKSEELYNTDEFKDYINFKREQTKSPFRIQEPNDVFTEDYLPLRLRRKQKEAKSIPEQIKDLSPELKAVLLAGVLDKKDYDEFN